MSVEVVVAIVVAVAVSIVVGNIYKKHKEK